NYSAYQPHILEYATAAILIILKSFYYICLKRSRKCKSFLVRIDIISLSFSTLSPHPLRSFYLLPACFRLSTFRLSLLANTY
ncbi:unnamed protein product, partial [Amoebophrya sp. A25]